MGVKVVCCFPVRVRRVMNVRKSTHELSAAIGDLQETGISAPAQLARPNSSLWFILAWTATITFHDQLRPARLPRHFFILFLFPWETSVLQGYLFYYKSYFFLFSMIQHFTELSIKSIFTFYFQLCKNINRIHT